MRKNTINCKSADCVYTKTSKIKHLRKSANKLNLLRCNKDLIKYWEILGQNKNWDMTVEAKKYKLIEKITDLQDEDVLNKLEILLGEYSKGNLILMEIVKPVREKFDIEQLKKEQNYQGFDKEEVDRLIKEIDIQEPIEELLKMV
jgi:hypothetical protein